MTHRIYKALLRRMEFLGLPYVYFFVFAAFAYVTTVVFVVPILNLLLIPLYIVARILNKRDQYFIEIVAERFNHKSFYDV